MERAHGLRHAHLRTERIDVRTSGAVKQLLQEAARAVHKTSANFCSTLG
ncbi:DUF1778 domain-containing protein [Ottowia sp.]